MNFTDAFEAAKMGEKVRRATWDPTMWVRYHTSGARGYLVHSHPYWETQSPMLSSGEFSYIVENDDPFAYDWEYYIKKKAR